MPCNAIAFTKAQVHLDPHLITNNPAALSAATIMLGQAFNTSFTVYDNQEYNWSTGYFNWCASQQPGKVFPQPFQLDKIAAVQGKAYVDFGADRFCVRLYMNGQVELRDGWDLRRAEGERAAGEQSTQLAQALFSELAGALAQAQLAQAIAANYPVLDQQYVGNNLVLTIEM